MPNRAIIMIVPAALKDNANLAFAKLGVGPNTISIPVSAAGNPSVITHYLCHWSNPSEAVTEVIGTWLSGSMITDCVDEYGNPVTVTWDTPNMGQARAAMMAITYKSIPYEDLDDYRPLDEVASMKDLAGLVNHQPG